MNDDKKVAVKILCGILSNIPGKDDSEETRKMYGGKLRFLFPGVGVITYDFAENRSTFIYLDRERFEYLFPFSELNPLNFEEMTNQLADIICVDRSYGVDYLFPQWSEPILLYSVVIAEGKSSIRVYIPE